MQERFARERICLDGRRLCRGLNLFETIAILLVLGGLAFGFARGIDDGLRQGVVGALIGAATGFGAYVAMMIAVLVPFWLWLLYRPFYPRCANGRCRALHYRALAEEELPELQATLREGRSDVLLVRCRCDALYCSSPGEGRFYSVNPDGSLEPYMRFRPYRRWEADTD